MFLINIHLRFALMGLFLVGGTLLAIFFDFWYAFPFLLVGLGLLVGYVLLGTVGSAAKLLQVQDLDGAEKRLRLTLNPKWLISFNRAYHVMLQGTIAMQRKDNSTAEKLLQEAYDIGLPSDNDKAIVLFQLVNIAVLRQNWPGAKAQFQKIKKLDVTEPTIKAQVKELEKIINQRGQIQAAQQQMRGGFRGGRRR